MMQNWQQEMQQYLSDPRTSELLIEQYVKAQEIFKRTADMFTQTQKPDSAPQPHDAAELAHKVIQLEQRVAQLEQILYARTEAGNSTSTKSSATP
jgi:hypothetical protein